MTRRDAGFSLIETLVAGAVLALTVAALALAFGAASAARVHAASTSGVVDATENLATDLSAYLRYDPRTAAAIRARGAYAFDVGSPPSQLHCSIAPETSLPTVEIVCADAHGTRAVETVDVAAEPAPGSILPVPDVSPAP